MLKKNDGISLKYTFWQFFKHKWRGKISLIFLEKEIFYGHLVQIFVTNEIAKLW